MNSIAAFGPNHIFLTQKVNFNETFPYILIFANIFLFEIVMTNSPTYSTPKILTLNKI